MLRRLWNYYRDEVNDDENEKNNVDYRVNNNKTTTSKSFVYKTKITGSTPNDNNVVNIEVVVLQKYPSNFSRSLDLPLINCEVELDLKWTSNCVISQLTRTLGEDSPPRVLPTLALSRVCSTDNL